jgi:hypothetical protein
MPRVTWPLLNGRPRLSADVGRAGRQIRALELLADSGAGDASSRFDLILIERDCHALGGQEEAPIALTGAYPGTFPVFRLRVQVPALGFDRVLFVVGVATAPSGFDGLACFCFLNRFGYGNFGDPARFGLEI